jgi:NAD(P)-dependent dehydrogenase (short-subunit alcohol dehydrogenase family)
MGFVFTFFIAILLILILFYIYRKKSDTEARREKLSNEQIIKASRIVIITGGNSGLGYHCAKNIAFSNKGFHVIVACRNQKLAESAVQKLIEETGNPNISFKLLYLSSIESIRAFVNDVIQNKDLPLFGLVCNAANNSPSLPSGQIQRTKEKIEITFGVNHLGHFLLSNLLLSHLSPEGRVVFVSSDMHNPPSFFGEPFSYIESEYLAFPEKSPKQLSRNMRYSLSKLCNMYCAYEMARRLLQTNSLIAVNAYNPGFVPETNLMGKGKLLFQFFKRFVMPIFVFLLEELGQYQIYQSNFLTTLQKKNGIKSQGNILIEVML